MMRFFLTLVCALSLVACGQGADTSGQASDPKSLKELRGQWLVINYWARWCKPCIEEIPELNALDKKFDDVTVLGVNFDGAAGEELAQQMQELGVDFTALAFEPAAELGIRRPAVLPSTLIIGPDGSLKNTLVGPQTLESLSAAVGK